MQKQSHNHVENDGVAMEHAIDWVQATARSAASRTEKAARRYPLASVGIALGAGLAVGFAARHLIAVQMRPKTLLERTGVPRLLKAALRRLG
jgi:hypothetical protein